MPYKDIEKRREAGRKSYKKHTKKARDRMNRYMKGYRKKKRELARKLVLFKGCYICGYKKCHRSLHFHHIDPSIKRQNVSTMISCNYAMKTFKKEIRKCVILCANCHGEVHEGLINLKKVIGRYREMVPNKV